MAKKRENFTEKDELLEVPLKCEPRPSWMKMKKTKKRVTTNESESEKEIKTSAKRIEEEQAKKVECVVREHRRR